MVSGLEKAVDAPGVFDLPDSPEAVLIEITGIGDCVGDNPNPYLRKGFVKDLSGILIGDLLWISQLSLPHQFEVTGISKVYSADKKGIILSGTAKNDGKPEIPVRLLYRPNGYNPGA